jgi:hypothetical protein
VLNLVIVSVAIKKTGTGMRGVRTSNDLKIAKNYFVEIIVKSTHGRLPMD